MTNLPLRPNGPRDIEDELEELIRYSHGRQMRAETMPPRGDALKIVLPWLITAGMFIWQASGQWTIAASATAKVAELELKMKAEYVTKDAFQHVATDVREIRLFLMGRGGRPQPQLKEEP